MFFDGGDNDIESLFDAFAAPLGEVAGSGPDQRPIVDDVYLLSVFVEGVAWAAFINIEDGEAEDAAFEVGLVGYFDAVGADPADALSFEWVGAFACGHHSGFRASGVCYQAICRGFSVPSRCGWGGPDCYGAGMSDKGIEPTRTVGEGVICVQAMMRLSPLMTICGKPEALESSVFIA